MKLKQTLLAAVTLSLTGMSAVMAGDLDAQVFQNNVGDVKGDIAFSEATITDSHVTADVAANVAHFELPGDGTANVVVNQLNAGNVEGSIDMGASKIEGSRVISRVAANVLTVVN